MSSVWSTPAAHPVRTTIDEAAAGFGTVVEAAMWSMTDTDVAEAVTALHQHISQAHGMMVRLVGEAEIREVPAAAGAPNAVQWLRSRLLVGQGEANAWVQTAKAVHSGMEATGAALSAGAIGLSQSVAITKAVTDLSSDVLANVKTDAEQTLLAEAERHDPATLTRLGSHIADLVDADAQDERDGAALERAEARAAARRCLNLSPDGEGGSWIRGRLDGLDSETLRAALSPFMKPRSNGPDAPDLRSTGQRRADALIELCRRQLDTGELPVVGGERPHVSVTVPLKTLQTGLGTATVSDGTHISATEARRLACDCALIPIVLGAHSIPLDVGRSQRLFTGALRRAVIARDMGCAFPGCDRPPSWCEVHHMKHWADGGHTRLDNGVLLCVYHHRLVEKPRHGWEVYLDQPPGLPTFRPPPGVDPNQQPIRNTMHRRQ